MYKILLKTNAKNETIQLGITISAFLRKGSVILLSGDLGAGKTTLTQGIAQGLQIKDNVISPTFNILKCYFGMKLNLYHIDAYRLENAMSDIGLEEFIDGDGACVVEWPQYINKLLPSNTLNIEILNKGDNTRLFTISSSNSIYEQLFILLENLYV
ncbi:MAG: tRNA (adenosine(37)-N6)-threonylcarbamoyltransferase complex ATPase subunit type 1 TsaE [Bacilli bacterium]